ncbi:hypothetical protein JCM33374_g4150 [Metschnikowia sp. JCM 33374]|nr:hypothetical protein JCM33374_g4150 [Metschnikowia sp. JCM 33374]
MRLGSSAAPSRRWSLEKTDPKELKEVKQSVDQRHSKDIFYELQKQHEEYKDKRDYNDDTEHKEVFTDETTAVSSPLSTWDTPSTAQSKYSSIQIKNLPIEPSQKRVNVPEPASAEDMIFAVCLVDFHHVRGPEVQWWRSNYHTSLEPEADINLFKNLAFQALPDGSHLFEETFSNFNLVYDFATRSSLDDSADIEAFKGNPNRLETLFGCSCVRQVKTTDLSETELERNKDITRSIVQKAVVVISRKQPVFTKIKEKLSIITQSFFQQDSFGNFELLESLFDNLNESFRVRDAEEITAAQSAQPKDPESQLEPENYEEQEEYFVNLNLRQLLSQFKNEILVILKALLLEKKVLVYSNNNLELLTQFQNNMIALIPNLINSLELSGCPLCDYTEKHSPLEKPTTLKTNDRMSMLRFFGLPLQVFNTKGSFWNPYLPLPQMEELNSRSFMVGCSNLLIVNQSAHFKVDLLVDLDAWSVTFPSGKGEELRLTPLDKKFISVLLASHTSREAYVGSDDYIRYQFEDYIRSLLATTRLHQYVERFKLPPPGFDIQTDKQLGSVAAFKQEFITQWQQTKNYHIWNATCDEFIFNFHSPKHLATEMNDPGAAYNLSGFLSSFKKAPPQPATTLTDKANQYFSHVQQPRKYIASDEQKETSPDLQSSESMPKDSTRSAWSWGFKKS